MSLVIDLIAISALSVVAPLAYLVWLRRADRFRADEDNTSLKAYVLGATLGVIGGGALTLILALPLLLFFGSLEDSTSVIVIAVVLAPIAEELVKGGCVMMFKKKLDRLENGLIFGASVGLGFATTENILYGYTASSEGLYFGLFLVGVRSVTGAFAHSSFTAVTGYGIARWRREGTDENSWLRYLGLAVLLHAFFNLVASASEIADAGLFFVVASTAALAFMTGGIFVLLRRRVVQLDALDREMRGRATTGP